MLTLARLAARAVPQRSSKTTWVSWLWNTRRAERVPVPAEVAALLREEHPDGPLEERMLLQPHGFRAVRDAVVYSADSGEPRVATASDDGSVRRWHALTGASVAGDLRHTEPVLTVVAFTGVSGAVLLASTGLVGVCVWRDRDDSSLLYKLHASEVQPLWHLAPMAGGGLACVGDAEVVILANPEAGAQPHDQTVPSPPLLPMRAPARSVCARGARSPVIPLPTHEVCVLEPGCPNVMLHGHTSRVTGIAAYCDSSGRECILTTSWDRTVRRWCAHTGDLLTGPIDVDETIACLTVGRSRTGSLCVFAGDAAGCMRVWCADTLARIGAQALPPGHDAAAGPAAVLSVDVHTTREHGTLLVAASMDAKVRVWSV